MLPTFLLAFLLAFLLTFLIAACNPTPPVVAPVVETPPALEATSTSSASAPPAVASEAAETDAPDTWMSGSLRVARTGATLPVAAIRVGSHPTYDRVVFEFSGATIPGYEVGYAARPVNDCASGVPLDIEGSALLQVRLAPAAAHDEAGASTTERETRPALTVVREIERSCDFEGIASWAIGTTAPNSFRVFELSAPPRLVIDVRH